MKNNDPLDVGLDLILLDDATDVTIGECDEIHPYWQNKCTLPFHHIPETHEDGAGHEWLGRDR